MEKKVQPPQITNLSANYVEVRKLLDLSWQVGGRSPAHKQEIDVLLKSAIVLLVACWEAFLEDLAKYAFEYILTNATTPDAFPASFLGQVSRDLKKESDDRRLWRLSGEGWKEVLREHKDEVLNRHVGNFNTPKPEQTDKMFEAMLGMKRLSDCWTWPGCTPSLSREKLKGLVELRGSIAHRVSASQKVQRNTVSRHLDFVLRLAVHSNNHVEQFVRRQAGGPGWQDYVHKQRNG